MKNYKKMCSKANVTGCWSEEITRLRSCRPQTAESTQPEQVESNKEEEIGLVGTLKGYRDPLGGGQIKDPVKNKYCGHIYDRTTMQEYIRSNRARRAMFYQCPYSLCQNKRNMDMDDMEDCADFLSAVVGEAHV
ncbi:hypothetical protein KIN20_035306 [Parelaphostrongylus tenuis]|uniref:E3 SUMO-protein ligase NSE2 n=1 Tax=Parelaphostrongylus tenuis TaxID=148309 RepID=A0AAD5RAX8_PARTN|nr:hypothetical protein KIN20_035306 [Parelaphostrongylus tenuis]